MNQNVHLCMQPTLHIFVATLCDLMPRNALIWINPSGQPRQGIGQSNLRVNGLAHSAILWPLGEEHHGQRMSEMPPSLMLASTSKCVLFCPAHAMTTSLEDFCNPRNSRGFWEPRIQFGKQTKGELINKTWKQNKFQY